ncbi:MAG TPA: molybdopterin-dependent oxidoreductase [Thermoanaerobaculia bacterium]|nr:molybdopterin-dependent oxidoreductase [Thermoanaerobaculia bacterium]
MNVLRTACPLDCPDSCSLDVTVEEGRLVRIDGADPERPGRPNPLTAGYICSKVRRFGRHLYGEERLRSPLLRRGRKGDAGPDALEAVSWEAAFDRVAEHLAAVRDQRGGEAILPLCYGGSNGLLTQDTADARLFHRLGASRLARTVCAAPTGRAAAGLYGKMPGVALEDYEHARLIVLWGVNPSVTGIHLVPIVQGAQAAGATLVVIDPRRTPLAKRADLHLQPRPGSDLALALCLLRELFARGHADREFLERHARGWEALSDRAERWTVERAAAACDLDATAIEHLVESYAAASPAVIRCGWGVERNRNGGSAAAAILALPAVAGKFGVRGGGYTMSNSGAWRTGPAADPPPPTRIVNMNRVGRALTGEEDPPLDPPIDLLFVYNCNPLVTLPHQNLVLRGLQRDDLFTVVFDQVMTDTAHWADIVLPATTFLEHDDLARGYGAQVLHRVRPVVDRVGEARSNVEVFTALLERLGLDREDDASDPVSLERALFGGNGAPSPVTVALDQHGVAFPPAGATPIQFVDCFPDTPDRRADLCPQALDDEAPEGLYAFRPDPGTARFPLALVSPATARTVSSTFGQLVDQPARLEMHPTDAAARGLDVPPAERVRVWNELGEVVCGLRLTADVRPGVVMLPKGLWRRSTGNGATSNALAPDTLADLGGGACFNDARVEVERA